MDVSRTWNPPVASSEASTSTAPSFPGLVSSLRPLKRLSTQLADEASLLRRFSYKNKNQHKGCGWWRKVVEVDRVLERVGTELDGLLGEFGMERKDKEEEAGRINGDAVGRGLLRVPRSMLVVEKCNSVLMGSASILEQLIHSRAFMAFALVVVSLIARLHALTTVLFEELGRTSAVLVRLVDADSLQPSIEKKLRQLPKFLRRFTLPSTSPASYPSNRPTSVPTSAFPTPIGSPRFGDDDFGAIVSRSELPPRSSRDETVAGARVESRTKTRLLSEPTDEIGNAAPSEQVSTGLLQLNGKEVASSEASRDGTGASTPVPPDTAIGGSATTHTSATPVKRKASAKKETEGHDGGVRRKKTKKAKGDGDEIDDIFG